MARRIPRASLDAWLRDVERLLEAHPATTDVAADRSRLSDGNPGAELAHAAADETAGHALRR